MISVGFFPAIFTWMQYFLNPQYCHEFFVCLFVFSRGGVIIERAELFPSEQEEEGDDDQDLWTEIGVQATLI